MLITSVQRQGREQRANIPKTARSNPDMRNWRSDLQRNPRALSGLRLQGQAGQCSDCPQGPASEEREGQRYSRRGGMEDMRGKSPGAQGQGQPAGGGRASRGNAPSRKDGLPVDDRARVPGAKRTWSVLTRKRRRGGFRVFTCRISIVSSRCPDPVMYNIGCDFNIGAV